MDFPAWATTAVHTEYTTRAAPVRVQLFHSEDGRVRLNQATRQGELWYEITVEGTDGFEVAYHQIREDEFLAMARAMVECIQKKYGGKQCENPEDISQSPSSP